MSIIVVSKHDMNSIFLIIGFASAAWINVDNQEPTTYKTRFTPAFITYNASDDPNQCWEAVNHGITVNVEKGKLFFEMPYEQISILKEKIKDAEVLIEIMFYTNDELEGRRGEALGFVKKIVMGGAVIYQSR